MGNPMLQNLSPAIFLELYMVKALCWHRTPKTKKNAESGVSFAEIKILSRFIKDYCPKLLSFQIEYWNSNFLFGNPNIFWKCNFKLGMPIVVWEIQFQIGNSNCFLEIQLKLGIPNFKFWKCFQFYFGNISNFNLEMFVAPSPVLIGLIKNWKCFQF